MLIVKARKRRRGTVLPLFALALMGLMGVIALAIDIGLIAVARTQAQNAADIAALTGARLLNGDTTSTYNISQSATSAATAATYNKILEQSVASTEVTVRTGQYKYNASLQRFEPDPASYTTSTSASPASGTGAWTASEATIAVTQPTYFARVLGVNSFNVGATATAVHRPRDIALILDFSGSMKFASVANWDTGGSDGVKSLNPDPAYPKFGHWTQYASMATTGTNPMQRTTNFTMSSGENNSPNNYTMETANGPAMVGSASMPNFVTLNGTGSYVAAFYCPQSGGYSATYSPCATPAPADWDLQSDTTATYVGDKAPHLQSNPANAYAKTVQEVLPATPVISSDTHARDHTWEEDGYGANFKGYSMGPAYYGKTFWQWPPDPRSGTKTPIPGTSSPVRYYYNITTTGNAGDPLNPSSTNPVQDTSNRWIADWRGRFFKYGSSHASAGLPVDDNNTLFDSSGQLRSPSSTRYAVNYPAILKWIKTGPNVFPSNLRSGRVLYYSAIPDDVASTSNLDQVFWKKYIDYVLGITGPGGTLADSFNAFHGKETTAWGTGKITAKSSLLNGGKRMGNTATNTSVTGPVGTSPAPYMQYQDNPRRPRAHFWFGPYTMLMFIADDGPDGNMIAGTSTESQCWQLKAGVQSAIDDVKKNHPNDWLSLLYFSSLSGFNTPRVKAGQDYTKMKNALWYPYTLLNNLGDSAQELRAIDSSFNYVLEANVPNARGGTCPEMGFKLAYNEFSMASGYFGRRGAAKMCILETDGVPNTKCNGSLNGGGAYTSLYTDNNAIGTTTYVSNGDTTVMNNALAVVTQICKPDDAANRGYSTTRTPARVHAIAFGDLFETTTTQKTTALQFLANVQIQGKTQAAGATSPESYKIIIGDYTTRIDTLRTAFERIMQSGVQVTLIR